MRGGDADGLVSAHSGLSDQARARLEEMIVSLELAPGSIWSEAELSARLGIGRTPVREALQRLEGDHLVRILPRHGAQITEINVVEQLLLLELRRALDRLIAADAARRCTAQERSQLLRMAERLEAFESEDVLAYLRQHYELKNFLAACARNPFVARAVMPCYAMSRRFYYLYYRQVPDIAVATKHHAEVIRAVVVGDEKAAAAASDRLMDYVEEADARDGQQSILSALHQRSMLHRRSCERRQFLVDMCRIVASIF